MLRVTIELFPFGDESKRKTLGVIDISNNGKGTFIEGSYNFKLTKEPPIAKKQGIWKKGCLDGFPRLRLGPYDLLYRVLHEAVGNRNK